MLGPAFVAAIAYVDPGNFATNLQAGAEFGYLLLWVVLGANLIAMVVQYLSAKLGIVTGKTLPELCRERFSRPVSWGLWVQAELMAMATDVAEFVGAALGLNLLFGLPLFTAAILTGVITFTVLGLQTCGYRVFELVIAALLAVVFVGLLYETLRIGPSATGSLRGLVPGLPDDSVLLAASIVGATVMPHVIYLHSALTKERIPCKDDTERAWVLRLERLDVLIALGLAGIVNLAMLAVAAKLFHNPLFPQSITIQQAHAGFAQWAGGVAALAFAVALFASGASSSSVGTYAGQVVMQGFTGLTFPLVLRRAITMAPAIILLGVGFDPTRALVYSQALLSFGIPFALIPLVLLTSDPALMGVHVNRQLTSVVAQSLAAVITLLSAYLIYRQFF